MEEESGVKAPVTRLRRRLSVETDDTRSPSSPSKKRTGRLAAKPQLELIDENVAQNSPKRTTRKSIARDITDTEDKPVTPARRSTRVKSNTSIVPDLETEDKPIATGRRTTRIKSNTSIVSELANEDKPKTPLQRTTRILSNTSIISETALSCDSPRAKRAAARRNSQVGSDTEVSVTPVKIRRGRIDSSSSADNAATPVSETHTSPGRTRRTKKDSTSSIEKQENSTAVNNPHNKETITEESATILRYSISNTDETDIHNKSSDSPRKSPRLLTKKETKDSSRKSDSSDNVQQVISDQTNELSKSSNTPGAQTTEHNLSINNKSLISSKDAEKVNMSPSSTKLLSAMDMELSKRSPRINKSTNSLTIDSEDFQTKRKRCKSWTPLSESPSKEGDFYSDNEIIKKKKKHDNKIDLKETFLSERGDSPLNTSTNKRQSKADDSLSKEPSTRKTASVQAENSLESEKENELGDKSVSRMSSATELLFENAPSAVVTSVLLIEDSDSNTNTTNEVQFSKQSDSGDQCVPVVIQEVSPAKPENLGFTMCSVEGANHNDSCEPMDVDETMPHDVTLEEFDNKVNKSRRNSSMTKSFSEDINQSEIHIANESSNKSLQKPLLSNSTTGMLSSNNTVNTSERKSSVSIVQELSENNSIHQENNKSKRKSSMSIHLESGNENKSTLILSQIKDVSSNEIITMTPKAYSAEVAPNAINIPDGSKDDKINKNLSINCITSTPVQQKENKIPMQMNSSAIEKQKDTSIKEKFEETDKSIEDSDDSDVNLSKHKSDFLDEVEDAGDDYESGDSRDDEEILYERDHEIVDKGDALSSGEELSNDTDYEKDSFVVSSDAEDKELLSGTEDDLRSSDNELTMSSKSKEKYNERKAKERKKVSKEMFEARHKLTKSDRLGARQPLDSTTSGDEVQMPKKKKRMRLDSSANNTAAQSDKEEKDSSVAKLDSENIGYKKKKTKRLLSDSINESVVNEKEITIFNENTEGNDPLLIKVKPEPKTPQKDLDMSVVRFTNRENIEQVQMDVNKSVAKKNDTRDPLATMAEETSESESSVSENEEISKNYEAMLEKLNNSKKKKTTDTSLNLDKKVKQQVKNKIVKQLNLTQPKVSKKTKDVQPEQKVIKNVSDESSSDSVDLKLLLSDDSNDSEKVIKIDAGGLAEKIFPLKRTDGKTDIRKTTSESNMNGNNAELNISSKKKIKECKSKTDLNNTSTCDGNIAGNMNFFIDTTGTHAETIDTSINVSLSSKKKNKNNSISLEAVPENEATKDDVLDDPVEVSFKKEKKKKRITKLSDTAPCDEDTTNINTSILKTPGSEKKKKIAEPAEATKGDNSDAPVEVSFKKDKNKKRNKKLSETALFDEDANNTTSILRTSGSEKKIAEPAGLSETTKDDISDAPVEVSFKKDKKKKSIKELSEAAPCNEDATNINTSILRTPGSEKKNKIAETADLSDERDTANQASTASSKKRKRKSSANLSLSEDTSKNVVETANELVHSHNNKKKRKISNYDSSEEHNVEKGENVQNVAKDQISYKKSKKNKIIEHANAQSIIAEAPLGIEKLNKKRKEREDDDMKKKFKIPKEHSLDNIHVPRLSSSVLHQLDDKPSKEMVQMKKSQVVATAEFVVEETIRRRTKPSNYLEESVYLNDDDSVPKTKKLKAILKPKVLPFIPTASTSDSGFTTSFQVKVIPEKIEFVAQAQVGNFKNDYLQNKRIKKLRTYDLYKKHRNIKLSKF